MTVQITHGFVSAKGDGGDPTLVQPSNWNAAHVINVDANSVIGNSTDSTGAAGPLPAGGAGLAVLAADSNTDLQTALANLGVTVATTGDMKPTLKFTADTGWIMADVASIGNTSSGAAHANADVESLYMLLWGYAFGSGNTEFPVTGGVGASASADWTAQKSMSFGPYMLGRAVGIGSSAGAGGTGLSVRFAGQVVGEENHTLTVGEAPPGQITFNDAQHTHATNAQTLSSGNNVQVGGGSNNAPASIDLSFTGASITDHAGGQAHNNMQPTIFMNWMVKL